MVVLIVWAFISYGITSIIVWGSIFEPLREFIKKHSNFLGSLISCVLCTSTWVGFFLSLTMFSITDILFQVSAPFNIFLDGMFSAGIVWTINSIVEFFEENRIK